MPLVMRDLDERLDLDRVRDLRGRSAHPWVRRALLTVIGAGVLVAASGAIGQPTGTWRAAGVAAGLQVEQPDTLRGGLLWRARIVVRATRAIGHPRIILGAGFAEGMQLNTIQPAPISEAGRGPRIVLTYAGLNAGDELVVYLQLQANPTTVGAQDTSVELDDEADPIVRIAHTTNVLP